MALKRIRQFITANLSKLSDQLSALEDNVKDETDAIRSGFFALPKAVLVNGSVSAQLSTVYALGQLLVIDSKAGGVAIRIAPATNKAPGFLLVAKRFASGIGNLTVSPVGYQVNAASSKVHASAGLYLYYFDGSNFWVTT